MLGIDVPIFAFTHCRDVAVEVSKAGGLGCFGAAFMRTPQDLKENLDWMDAHVGEKFYGVDIVFPYRYEGKGEGLTAEQLEAKLWSTIPQAHRDFADRLLTSHGVPRWPDPDPPRLGGMSDETTLPLFDEVLRHPKCKVVVNALGTPPAEIINRCHESGRLIGALSGRKKHALRHKAAGLDFIIANGHEGGGHTGTIGSIVLWPELVDAVAPVPVLAAGGIGNGRQLLAALSMGAQGVWTGSLWLCVAEASTSPKQKERYLKATIEDTVISRSWSGKTARFLRNEWAAAWEGPESPGILSNPQQWLLTSDARRRLERYGDTSEAQEVAFAGAGQVIGQINHVETSRQTVQRLIQEYADALERVNGLTPPDAN